ncbi:MAG: PHP domain-containing protein, partial [Clostridiaceae bacterium]|nr:PHP domain-containing protein [Clostridiaceae bacterium]
NTPRQNFICYAMENPEFANLIDSTWALIAHEKIANQDPDKAFFSTQMLQRYPKVEDRIDYFKSLI